MQDEVRIGVSAETQRALQEFGKFSQNVGNQMSSLGKNIAKTFEGVITALGDGLAELGKESITTFVGIERNFDKMSTGENIHR